MVNLKQQYLKIKDEINFEIDSVLESSQFIKGQKVSEFESQLGEYLNVKHVISCGNGTDALMISLMALNLKPNDEVICPSFSFISSAEVIALLGFRPVFVDVNYENFNVTAQNIIQAISNKTRAIIPVHLFGQGAEMESIMEVASDYNLAVVEDNAQSLGAEYTFKDNTTKFLGTIGDIGCTSFFPTKNLACYGDGGAMFTNDDYLAERLRLIANHGMKQKYRNECIGVNSRLDTLQAGVLKVKLKYLDKYIAERRKVAEFYNKELEDIKQIIVPKQQCHSTHTYNQYTIKVLDGKRDNLKQYLFENGVSSQVYYPIPLHKQQAFSSLARSGNEMTNAERLCGEVLSLPMHTELSVEQLQYIVSQIKTFFQ